MGCGVWVWILLHENGAIGSKLEIVELEVPSHARLHFLSIFCLLVVTCWTYAFMLAFFIRVLAYINPTFPTSAFIRPDAVVITRGIYNGGEYLGHALDVSPSMR